MESLYLLQALFNNIKAIQFSVVQIIAYITPSYILCTKNMWSVNSFTFVINTLVHVTYFQVEYLTALDMTPYMVCPTYVP